MSPVTKKHNKFIRTISYPFRFILKSINKTSYVKFEYHYITGHKLHLKNPRRYTEKLQYLRLYQYPNDPLVIQAASRVGLREYIKKIGLEKYLIKTYGNYDRYQDIDFDKLPNQFVLKCNHASGYNKIVKDKSKINHDELNKRFNKWLNSNYGKKTVEPHYSKIKPSILIEELLLENHELPIEYKIHVFNGKAKYMYIVTGRNKDIHYNNYYIDWTDFDRAQFNHWTSSDKPLKKPDCFNEAIKIAESVAAPFPFVRVDLFIIDNKIYISELTFTPAKGTLTFKDDKVDYEIGEWLNI